MDRSYYEFSEEAKRRFHDRLRWLLVGVRVVWNKDDEVEMEMGVDNISLRGALEEFYSLASICYKELPDDMPLAKERIAMLRSLIETELEHEHLCHAQNVRGLVEQGVRLIWEAINHEESDIDDEILFELLMSLSRVNKKIQEAVEEVRLNTALTSLEASIAKYIDKGEFDDYYIHKLVRPILDTTTWEEFKRNIDMTLKLITLSGSAEPPVMEP